MKIESVNVDEILGTESKGIYGVHEEEKKGIFKKLFDRCIADDLSDEGVFEGKINEERSIRELF